MKDELSQSLPDILVGMLKRERERVAGLKTDDDRTWDHRDQRQVPAKKGVSRQSSLPATHGESSEHQSQTTLEERGQPGATKEEAREEHNRKKISHSKQLADDMSQGRREAFEVFRSDYPHNAAIEENKRTLKQRYSEAKSLGEQVNNSRKRINTLKTQIEQHRIRRSMQVNGDEDGVDEEDRLRNSIEEEKSRYKDAFTRLRSLKTEIEHLQHLLEKSKVQMQKDFEAWWAEQSSLPHRTQNGKPTHEMKRAWKTPTPPLSPIKPQDHRPRSSTDPRRRLNQDHLRSSDILSSRLQTEVSLSSFPSSSSTVDTNSVRQDRASEMPVRDSPRHHSNRREIKDAYESAKRLNSANSSSSLKLTGDSRADEDILAFIRARQTLLNQKGSNES